MFPKKIIPVVLVLSALMLNACSSSSGGGLAQPNEVKVVVPPSTNVVVPENGTVIVPPNSRIISP